MTNEIEIQKGQTANKLLLMRELMKGIEDMFETVKNEVTMEHENMNTKKNANSDLGAVSGSDLVKSDWSLREYFKQLRFDKNHHLGLGDIRLTIGQQEEICDLVERFYHCR